ncbi:MAG TPA: DUF6265 family protein [Phycisphaerae bacterium]|nr:DUF6265 family protein [Phycisphaerae bacterium]
MTRKATPAPRLPRLNSLESMAPVLLLGFGAVLPAPQDSASRQPRVADLAFLAGVWQERSPAGLVEETWSQPRHENMVGMLRWLKADGSPRLYELLTLTKEDGQVVLRIRHFDPPDLAPWASESERPTTLRLRDLHERKAVFINLRDDADLETITYDAGQRGILRTTLAFRLAANRPPIVFTMSSAAAGNEPGR